MKKIISMLNRGMKHFKVGEPDKRVGFSKEVLDGFRESVGRYPAETGGMLGSKKNHGKIDLWCFDKQSQNTSVSYSYDVDTMSAVCGKWKSLGYVPGGFVHSHPFPVIRGSYDDFATAWQLMKYFKNDYFYLPILMSHPKGLFTMYFYHIQKKDEETLSANLDYVLRANEEGYEYIPFEEWRKEFNVSDLETYYQAAQEPVSCEENLIKQKVVEKTEVVPNKDYFQRIQGLYPEHVLNKVIVAVGCGGLRSYLENMARNGFKNFITVDGDTVAPSNVATQGVFISEMGKKKVHAIRDRLKDINPEVNILCIDKFLDDSVSDEEFKSWLKKFPGRNTTDFLILGCTDDFHANKRCAALALKYGIPYIGAGMYTKGLAAEVQFVYPGVTESCPRCMLNKRFEHYENGYVNDVTSVGCTTFATERLNTLIGYLSLMILMYNEASESPYNKMLDEIKNRNFAWIRLTPYLGTSELGIGFFDRVFKEPEVYKYTFMDETLWIPQHPDSPEYGSEPCKLCGGVKDLRKLRYKWADTRKI